jgi:hypothetical protein
MPSIERVHAKRLGRIEVDLDALPDGRAEASTGAWEEGDLSSDVLEGGC